jgi:hypothetical protein
LNDVDDWQMGQPSEWLAQNPEIKEVLETRSLIAQQTLARLDRCFSLVGEKPVKMSRTLQDTFVEDFRREVGEINRHWQRNFSFLPKSTI